MKGAGVKMNSFQMINLYCNNFIEDFKLGNQKLVFGQDYLGDSLKKVFLKYLKSLDFDINKYPQKFKNPRKSLSLLVQKNRC